MPDYKITQVSSQPPREWGEGTKHTYYIRTMLEGHPRPVEIGKKKLGTLSPGMTVTGTIIPKPDFEADGWKADTFGGGFSGGGSKPAYQPRDDDAIRAQWAIGQAVTAHLGQPKSDGNLHFDVIEEYAERFYAMVGRVKSSNAGGTPDPKAPNPATSQPTGNPARLKKGDPVWPSDHEDAEAASLYQSVAQAEYSGDEDIPLDQIPF